MRPVPWHYWVWMSLKLATPLIFTLTSKLHVIMTICAESASRYFGFDSRRFENAILNFVLIIFSYEAENLNETRTVVLLGMDATQASNPIDILYNFPRKITGFSVNISLNNSAKYF